jgi:CRISPR/Cas system Type II protein with McrA/HNH and RuvC-like nuclease domain
MKALFDAQAGRCTYTAVALVPGVNASVDHRVPISRGGPHSIENVHWVDRRVNIAKADMTHEEFIAMCEEVVEVAYSGKTIRSPSVSR